MENIWEYIAACFAGSALLVFWIIAIRVMYREFKMTDRQKEMRSVKKELDGKIKAKRERVKAERVRVYEEKQLAAMYAAIDALDEDEMASWEVL